MPHPAIVERMGELEAYFDRADAPDIADETKSDLARLGIVLIAGFIERGIEIIITHRLEDPVRPQIHAFLKTHFERGSNYRYPAIRNLLRRFDNRWDVKFQEEISGRAELREAIDTAYELRNSIAHGGARTATLQRARELYAAAKEVVTAIEEATA
jgi:cellulose biosynthesis protein BcsQ